MLSGEATNTNFIVFGLTRPGLEPTIYCIRGEHDDYYATDAVDKSTKRKNELSEFCVFCDNKYKHVHTLT